MTEQLPFNGILNLDDNNNVFPVGCHKMARNVLFKGMPGNYRAENVPGTRNITYTLPAGTNECVGSYYDPLRLRVIWFNHNSNGKHGIYQMKVNGEVITPITVCDTVDYLNFNFLTIHSINILYGDDTIGDILYFIDNLNRPTKININRAIAGGYGTMQRSFIEVAKEPPLLPPTVAYIDDGTATVNNMRKALFQFKYRWVFDDKEKSTWSALSEMPVPVDYLNPVNDADPTKNSLINVTLLTGDRNVKKIEIAARQNIDNTYSDAFLLTTLNKATEGIADNTTYVYAFKNNNAAEYINVAESNLLFDYVPKEANTQELLNGNIVIYGGIKEGYTSAETLDVSLAVDTVTIADDSYSIVPLYNFWSKYKFGLVYFDDKGRTNGVVTNTDFDVSTPGYTLTSGTLNIPRITASINHHPPVWAKTFQWVRTKNLTLLKFLYWVSESTFKDNDYAYIGIQNLYDRKEENQKTILTYDFTPGDRIRFISVNGGSILTGKDYEIKEFVNSPEVGGTQRQGFFLKIKLPATDTAFDFGATGFGNYFIELYSNAPVVDNGLNVYYEFGEAYSIGNPGLTNRYHKGGTQDQTDNLSAPAIFVFTKGDVYAKNRTVLLGGGIESVIVPSSITSLGSTAWTVPVNVVSEDTLNSTYLSGNSSSVDASPLSDLDTNNTDWIIKTVADGYNFRIKGQIKISVSNPMTFKTLIYITPLTSPFPNTIELIPTVSMTPSGGIKTYSFDKTFYLPPSSKAFIVTDLLTSTGGDFLIYQDGNLSITNINRSIVEAVDANFSDTFLSAVNSNGRPLVIDENGETYNPTMVRYGEAYQAGTNINNTNRFYPLNYDEYDRAKGDIRRLKVRGPDMRVFQSRGCGAVPVFQQILSNADGSANVIQSDKIINTIRYYQGEYGMGNQAASLASSAGADYFSDPVRGYQCRVAGDGITPISELYKAQYYLPPILKLYTKGGYVNDAGSVSRILGVYDFLNEDFLTVLQMCNNDNVFIDYPGDTLAFNEPDNAYRTFFDFAPESIVCAGTTMVSFKDGSIHMHDSAVRNTFYGTFYPSIVDRVINAGSNVKKVFTSIGYHSDSAWGSAEITTAMGQLSNLIEEDYEYREGMYTASFWGDINSPGALINGDYLNAVWMQIRLQNSLSTYQMLYGLFVNYLISQKNF